MEKNEKTDGEIVGKNEKEMQIVLSGGGGEERDGPDRERERESKWY